MSEPSASTPSVFEPLIYDYAGAAKALGCTERYLRRHISTLPHRKIGRVVSFTPAHIAAISAAVEVTPPAYYVGQLRPLSRRRRKTS